MEDDIGMRYPDGLTYLTSRINAWSVATTRMTPEAVRDAEPGSYVTFRMPDSQLCQLSSFCIMGDTVGIRGTGDNDQVVFPRGSWAFIEQLTVSINGSVVENIVGYNHVHQLFHDMQGGSRFSSMAPLQHTRNFNPIGVGTPELPSPTFNKSALPTVGLSQAPDGPQGVTAANVPTRAETDFFAQSAPTVFSQNAIPMAWFDWCGFLRCGRWLDVSTLGVVEVTLKFASDRILKRRATGAGTTATRPSYRVQNLRAFVNVASVDDGVLYNAMAARLQQAPLTIPYKKFTTYNSRPLTASGSVNFSLSTPSLDAVYAMLLDPNPADNDPLAQELIPAILSSSATAIPAGAPTALGQIGFVSNASNQIHRFPGDTRPAPYFLRYAASKGNNGQTGYVKSTQLRINSVAYPSWPASVDEQYYLALNAFRSFDDDIGVAPDMTYENWHLYQSFFAYRLSYGKGLDWVSGIDSRGINTQCVIEYVISPPIAGADGAAFNLRPFVIAESTSMLMVSAYRSINIV